MLLPPDPQSPFTIPSLTVKEKSHNGCHSLETAEAEQIRTT